MSSAERVAEVPVPVARERRRRRPPRALQNWWRHLVAIIAVVVALFPPAYVVSAAFNADDTLSGATLIPRKVTTSNFSELFTNKKENARTTPTQSSHYGRWFLNSILVAGFTAVLTVLLGALAAYAFSRFRFRGRRVGMLSLLLVQMFPQLLTIVAIYLILLRTGTVFSFLGLNTLTGLVIVYLGGSMGVNVWLMKGFFDTIPSELDESARVDGATPAQIFWSIVLPLAAPVLAVIGLISFVTTINEYIVASIVLQSNGKLTLPLGLFKYIDTDYAEHWGPFSAGVLIAAVPAIILFVFLQPYIVKGLTQGSVKG